MSTPQGETPPSQATVVEHAITSRRSIRAFLPNPVPESLVRHLLDVAARAPSGTNMQPWRAYAVAGSVKDRLTEALLAAHQAGDSLKDPEYRYYPPQFFEPYLSRRRKVGWDLYTLLDIKKGDAARMVEQHGRNFAFFNAPVGLIFTIDRRLEIGSWLDYGMFLENIMIAARGHGLATCAQAAFASLHGILRKQLPISDQEMVVCGMSLGYADETASENRLVTERISASAFTDFLGFERPSEQG